MAEKDNIPEMRPTFDAIRRTDENNKEYWSSRDLCNAMGYSTNWKFQNVINKAIAVANQKGMKIDDHFNQTVDMVKLGSGAYRKVNIFRLSRMACMIIAENADGKKPLVQQAREYFSQSVSTTELIQNSLESNILLYKTAQGETRIEVIFNNETFWMSQKRMADLFGVDRATIAYHLSQVYESGELTKEATCRKIQQVQLEGERDVERTPLFYNLDAIIAVGYRVSSLKATRFRQWATKILNEYIKKGFAMDDERLKQGNAVFGKDYFRELLERIRSIRTSERRIWQQITDIYAECSTDYDKNSPTTRDFYAMIQNRFHYAITGQTAAEIIYSKADHTKDHMGLTTWKNAPDGRVLKSDVSIAKNYLQEKEIRQLERAVTGFFDYIEDLIERENTFNMSQFSASVNEFLTFRKYQILPDKGKISAAQAKKKAEEEYDIFNKTQRIDSDFDKEVRGLLDKG